jgi:GTPase SAR1 family protein
MGNKGLGKKKEKKTAFLKVLILGISGSGKSTFTKQMKVIHQGFNKDEIDLYKDILRQNIMVGMQELVKQAEKLEIRVASENRKHGRYFLQMVVFESDLDAKVSKKVKALWADPAIQQTWNLAPSFQMQMSNLEYLMTNIDRIADVAYEPTKDDILQARQRTTGQQSTTFTKDKYTWELIDVGGQKPERAKWEGLIQEGGLNAIIYFAGLDEFNMQSSEEKGKTKMQISMEVFSEVLHSVSKNQICLLLFLNKLDLFEKKIKDEASFQDFKKYFPDYKGEAKVDTCCDFIRDKFISALGDDSENLEVHTHITCALDTDAMTAVFEAVKDNIFMKRIASARIVI